MKRSMKCREVVELITDYLEGVLDPRTAERVEAHLAKCDGCAAYLEQFRATVTTVGRIEEDDLDPAFRDRLLAAFEDFR